MHDRINSNTTFLMVSVAVAVDSIQFMLGGILFIPLIGFILFPIINVLLSLFVWMTFFLWFKIRKVGFIDRGWGKIVIWLIGASIEIVFGVLPAWTPVIIATIWFVRAEDKRDNDKIMAEAAA